MTDAELGKYFFYIFWGGILIFNFIKPSFLQRYLWVKLAFFASIYVLVSGFINPAHYGANNFNELFSVTVFLQQLLIPLIPAFLWVTFFTKFLKIGIKKR